MPNAQFQTLTPAQVEARINAEPDVKIVDVRTPEEHAAYHIPGSLLLPLQELPGLIAGHLSAGRRDYRLLRTRSSEPIRGAVFGVARL